jgi:hypothetical protein
MLRRSRCKTKGIRGAECGLTRIVQAVTLKSVCLGAPIINSFIRCLAVMAFMHFQVGSHSIPSNDNDSAGINPVALRCEYRQNPLGVDDSKPRLSWRVESVERGQRQSAYRVLVASSPELLAEGVGDLWDSGKVASPQTAHIEYSGKPLGSRQACYWNIRVWDRNGVASEWSRPASWSMGLLGDEEWTAKYIVGISII